MAMHDTDLGNDIFFQIIIYTWNTWIKHLVFKVFYTTAKTTVDVECCSINIIVHERINRSVLKLFEEIGIL